MVKREDNGVSTVSVPPGQHESSINRRSNVVSVRASTKNLSAMARELGESGSKCADLSAKKARLQQEERADKLTLQKTQSKLAAITANQRQLYLQNERLQQEMSARIQQVKALANADLVHLRKAIKEAGDMKMQRDIEIEQILKEVEVEKQAAAALRQLVTTIKGQLQIMEKKRDRNRHLVDQVRRQHSQLLHQVASKQRSNQQFADSLRVKI